MITRETLDEFFDSTRERFRRGEMRFSIDEVCRWSYFFVDPERSKLKPVADRLDGLGYEVKGFLDPSENDDNPVYFLRADRIERHTVDSLLARNEQLHEIARRFEVEDYDGMDVGAVDGP